MSSTVEKIDDLLSVSCYENLVIALFSGPVRASHIAEIARVSEDRLLVHAGGLSFVTMSADSLPAPSLSLRAPVREFWAKMGLKILQGVVVVDDDSIFASARRAFLRGIMLLIGRHNLVIVSDVHEATERLCAVVRDATGQPVDRADLERVLLRCEADLRLSRLGSAALG